MNKNANYCHNKDAERSSHKHKMYGLAQLNLPVLIVVAVLCNALYNLLMIQLGYKYPFTTFLFDPSDIFADFFKSLLSFPGPKIRAIDGWSDLLKRYYYSNVYHGVEGLYINDQLTHFHQGPLSVLYKISARHLIAYVPPFLVFILYVASWLVPLVIFSYVNALNKSMQGIASLMLSYPTLMVLSRGNMEAGYVGLCIIVAMFWLVRGAHQIGVSWLLAVAINLKPNAVLLLFYYFSAYGVSKGLMRSLTVIFLSAIVFLVSLYWANALYPEYNLDNFLKGLKRYQELYVYGDMGLGFGSSLFGGVKLLGGVLGLYNNPRYIEILAVVFLFTVMIGFLMAVSKFKINVSPLASAYLSLCFYILLPSVCGDYHLIVFFVFVLLLSARGYCHQLKENPQAISTISLTALMCLVPKNYIYFGGVSAQVLVNPVVLLVGVIGVMLITLNSAVENNSYFGGDSNLTGF